jgi:hypothetical protein
LLTRAELAAQREVAGLAPWHNDPALEECPPGDFFNVSDSALAIGYSIQWLNGRFVG